MPAAPGGPSESVVSGEVGSSRSRIMGQHPGGQHLLRTSAAFVRAVTAVQFFSKSLRWSNRVGRQRGFGSDD